MSPSGWDPTGAGGPGGPSDRPETTPGNLAGMLQLSILYNCSGTMEPNQRFTSGILLLVAWNHVEPLEPFNRNVFYHWAEHEKDDKTVGTSI